MITPDIVAALLRLIAAISLVVVVIIASWQGPSSLHLPLRKGNSLAALRVSPQPSLMLLNSQP